MVAYSQAGEGLPIALLTCHVYMNHWQEAGQDGT